MNRKVYFGCCYNETMNKKSGPKKGTSTVSRAVFLYLRNNKKVPDQLLVLWNRGPLKILNGITLILDDQGNHLDLGLLGLILDLAIKVWIL